CGWDRDQPGDPFAVPAPRYDNLLPGPADLSVFNRVSHSPCLPSLGPGIIGCRYNTQPNFCSPHGFNRCIGCTGAHAGGPTMIVVVGAGVAGLTAVERLATAGAPVTLLTAGNFGADAISAGNTALAQGGIAAALGPDDSALLHFGDTMLAGAGLVDPAAAEVLTTEGAERVREFLSAGFPADTDAQGKLTFGLEAAHRRARILHAGEDSTGAALSDFLTNRVHQLADDGRVHIIEKAW